MADPEYPSFQIADFLEGNAVAGRNCGSALTKRTVFTRLVAQEFSGPGRHLQRRDRIVADSLEIRIESMEAYGQTLDEVFPGLTALLRLGGTGLELLKPPDSERTYLALEAPNDRVA